MISLQQDSKVADMGCREGATWCWHLEFLGVNSVTGTINNMLEQVSLDQQKDDHFFWKYDTKGFSVKSFSLQVFNSSINREQSLTSVIKLWKGIASVIELVLSYEWKNSSLIRY